MRKFWVRHFEKLCAGTSLLGAVTAVVLIVAIWSSGDAAAGWVAAISRPLWSVAALGVLALSVLAAVQAFGLTKQRFIPASEFRPEYLAWWAVVAFSALPLLALAATGLGWGLLLFASDVAPTAGDSGFSRVRAMEKHVFPLVAISGMAAQAGKLFRVTRRDADGDRVLKVSAAG